MWCLEFFTALEIDYICSKSTDSFLFALLLQLLTVLIHMPHKVPLKEQSQEAFLTLEVELINGAEINKEWNRQKRKG